MWRQQDVMGNLQEASGKEESTLKNQLFLLVDGEVCGGDVWNSCSPFVTKREGTQSENEPAWQKERSGVLSDTIGCQAKPVLMPDPPLRCSFMNQQIKSVILSSNTIGFSLWFPPL